MGVTVLQLILYASKSVTMNQFKIHVHVGKAGDKTIIWAMWEDNRFHDNWEHLIMLHFIHYRLLFKREFICHLSIKVF